MEQDLNCRVFLWKKDNICCDRIFGLGIRESAEDLGVLWERIGQMKQSLVQRFKAAGAEDEMLILAHHERMPAHETSSKSWRLSQGMASDVRVIPLF